MNKRLIVFGFFLSGVAALIYEVIWTRAFSLIIGSTTYAMSTVLAAFMAGLALGAFLGGKYLKEKNPIIVFGTLEFVIGIFGIFILILIRNLSPIYAWVYYTFKATPSVYFFIQFFVVFLVMLIPTTLMGASFPAVIKCRAKSLDKVAEDTGYLYSANTVGAVIGATVSGFFLIPHLGLSGSTLCAAALNLFIAVLMLGKSYKQVSLMLIVFATVASTSLSAAAPKHFFNIYSASRTPSYEGYKKSLSFFKIIWEKEDIEGTVQVMRGGDSPVKSIFIRGKPEGVNVEGDHTNQVLMAYLPAASNPQAKKFLKIGLGPGVTLAAASKLRTLSSIDVIEINSAVTEAVEMHFFPELFKDPRITFINADARNHLLLSEKRYDIMTSQPSDPTGESSGFLFTKEFFLIAKERLTENGVFCQFVPYYLLGPKGTSVIIKTFASVFPYVYSWDIKKGSNNLLLIGSISAIKDTPETIRERVEGYESNLSSNYFFGAGPEKVRELVINERIPLNTDDKPIVEFMAAKNLML